jgi:ribonuclease HI
VTVELWTDGSGTSEGPGGWAFLLRHRDRDGKIFDLLNGGQLQEATNNRAELTAAIEGLRALKRRCAVTIVTDSEYVMKPFTEGWLAKWRAKGWRTSRGDVVANQDLLLELEAEVSKHQVSWRHVRGHAGVEENELVDQVAGMMRRWAIAAADAAAPQLALLQNENDPPATNHDGPLDALTRGAAA